MTQWDFQNKGTLTSSARLSFVLKVPLRHLRPSVIYSVPCDRILQMAYWCVGETLFVTTCHWSERTDALHPNPSWRPRSWWSYPAEEDARDYRLHCGCLSTTKQVLLWYSVTGQSKRRKTPGSFVGLLSDLPVSDESEVELTKWLVSKTLTGLVNWLGFAMWYFEKRADGATV